MRTRHETDDQAEDQTNGQTDQAARWRRVAVLDGQVARALEDVNAALGALEVTYSRINPGACPHSTSFETPTPFGLQGRVI